MERYCQNCGSLLSDDANVCSACGAVVELEQPAKGKKKKPLWIIPVAVLLVVLLVAAFFWKPIFMRISPHAYLYWTINRTNADMNKRQQGTSFELLTGIEDCMKKGTIDVDLEYDNPSNMFAWLEGDMIIKSDIENKKWSAAFNLAAPNVNSDFTLFINDHHASFGTSKLRGGQHIGITYDTFAKDLRNSSFGKNMSDEQIDALAEPVDAIASAIRSCNPSEESLKAYQKLLEEFILDQKPELGSTTLAIGEKDTDCDTMTFRIPQDDLIDLLEDLLARIQEDNSIQLSETTLKQYEETLAALQKECNIDLQLTYTFYDNKVIGMDICAEGKYGEEETDIAMKIDVDLGADVSVDDIIINYNIVTPDGDIKGNIISEIYRYGNNCKDTISMNVGGSIPQETTNLKLEADWNRDESMLKLRVVGYYDGKYRETNIPMTVKQKDDGFDFYIENLADCMNNADKNNAGIQNGEIYSLLIKFRKDCKIDEPQYINLDRIDTKLIKDISALLGIYG